MHHRTLDVEVPRNRTVVVVVILVAVAESYAGTEAISQLRKSKSSDEVGGGGQAFVWLHMIVKSVI